MNIGPGCPRATAPHPPRIALVNCGFNRCESAPEAPLQDTRQAAGQHIPGSVAGHPRRCSQARAQLSQGKHAVGDLPIPILRAVGIPFLRSGRLEIPVIR